VGGGDRGPPAARSRPDMTLADTEFAKLTDFQRDTVAYVLNRFYGPDPTDRFLVADEVGMGKTLVARGVIAGVIDHLRRPEAADVERIDVLYICSNANIARQNISKLDVLGEGTVPMSTRITLLANHLGDLNRPRPDGQKVVNLVAFTPGTSFQKGHTGGQVAERALLAHFTEPMFASPVRANAMRRLLRGGVKQERWRYELERAARAEPDPGIGREYLRRLRGSPLAQQLRRLVDRAVGRGVLSDAVKADATALIGELRHVLARASVQALEPDLIILDEFQRFRHLLESPEDGEETEVSRLARELFEYKDAKVLLLSATPYKLFTLPEEQALTGDDHYRDFLATVRFLAHHDPDGTVADLGDHLAEFRDRLITGTDPVPARDAAQQVLRSVMCRTERPTLGEANLLHERCGDVDAPTAGDLTGFVRMRQLAKLVDGDLSVEYWKSAPYFLSFMDGYQLSRRYRDAAERPEVRAAIKGAPRIRPKDVSRGRPIDPANARLRALQAETTGRGLHQLLWMPPSMPYHAPGGAYAALDPATTTKRLIFSSWAAAPSSIAALLSHEASRTLAPPRDARSSPRLTFNTTADGRPERMSTVLLTVPQPGLAELCDPLAAARRHPDGRLTVDELVEEVAGAVVEELAPAPARAKGATPDTWYWYAPLAWPGAVSSYAAIGAAAADGGRRRRAHLSQADALGEVALGDPPDDLARWTAMVGLASPANCAWRAIRRVTAAADHFSDDTVARGAVIIAEGFRTLFNRPEVMAAVELAGADESVYWQQVLEYCLAGNLQAVLDEYLHHLFGNTNPTNDDQLIDLAEEVSTIIGFGRGRVEAFNPNTPERPIRFPTRFALRYGNARGSLARDDSSAERAADVQAAFNSPFWPFVLASTSVGQEGVDFHWWCHALVHWNQPANVVDLEQREGRVHRFKGHAVRKNVAERHWGDVVRSAEADPWAAAFAAAAARRPSDMNDLWPYWVYPGGAKVECWVPYMPLSRDEAKEQRLRRDRVLYRLAFGQPRQDDLLAVLDPERLDSKTAAELRIDLRPHSVPRSLLSPSTAGLPTNSTNAEEGERRSRFGTHDDGPAI
jgi:hypothetical protein